MKTKKLQKYSIGEVWKTETWGCLALPILNLAPPKSRILIEMLNPSL